MESLSSLAQDGGALKMEDEDLQLCRRIPFQWNFKELLQQCPFQALSVAVARHPSSDSAQLLFLKEVSITL